MQQEIRTQFSEVFKSVNQSTGSLFSKTDVILLLENLENKILDIEASVQKSKTEETKIDIEDLKDYIEENLYSIIDKLRTDEVIDFDSAEFTMDSNCISLADISLNESNLENKLAKGIIIIIDKYKIA